MTNEEYEEQFRKKWDAGDFEYVSQGYGTGFDQDYIWNFVATVLDEVRKEEREKVIKETLDGMNSTMTARMLMETVRRQREMDKANAIMDFVKYMESDLSEQIDLVEKEDGDTTSLDEYLRYLGDKWSEYLASKSKEKHERKG